MSKEKPRELSERVALVTGAARGIGLAVATQLHREGTKVVLVDIDLQRVEQEAATLGRYAWAIGADLTDPAAVDRMITSVSTRWGRVDILVNNAGLGGQAASVTEYPIEEWRRVMSINIDAVFYCTRAIIPLMLSQGAGRIVNIASIAGKEGNPRMPAYSASKAAVIGFTKSVAKEVAQSGILVNCVTPAVIETEMLSQLTPEAVDYMVAKIPMARPGRAEEVAELVCWLASPACSFSTGAVFDISGGRATY